MSYDDWKTRTPPYPGPDDDRAPRMTPYMFRCACDGLRNDIHDACLYEWGTYQGYLSDMAWLHAVLVVRMARHLGLYPTTEQLEAETREVV